MKKHLAALARHRHKIQEEIERQRIEVSNTSKSFQKPVMIFDMGWNIFQFIRCHPSLISAGFVTVSALWRKQLPRINILLPLLLRFAFKDILSSSKIAHKKHG
jgi:hypothetical protein